MLTVRQVIDRYFLETRCQLLEIAATLDRHDAATGPDGPEAHVDPRWDRIYQSLDILARRASTSDRAARLLQLFSDPVD